MARTNAHEPDLAPAPAAPGISDAALPFDRHAREVTRAIQASIAESLLSLGADPATPQSISHHLKINKNLAWKVSRIIHAEDAAAALEQMPGGSGIKILLRSIESAGVNAPLLESTRRALDEYERLIKVHSGDRATLEMMGSGLGSSGARERDEQHRKQLFHGASYVWGAQARSVLKLGIVGPGEKPGLLDFASLNALVDFRRLRPDVSWVIARRQSNNDDGTDMPIWRSEPADAARTGPDDPPLMLDFCTSPMPTLRRTQEGATTSFEVVDGPVGNTGAITCVAGVIQRGIPYYRAPENEWGIHSARCDIPSELMVVDMFFHRDLTFAIPPEAVLFSDLAADMAVPARERKRLPLNETLQDLGISPLMPATPEIPRYRKMVDALFKATGWSPTDFHGFRMKIAYPAYPTSLALRYRLPEAPR